jgi:hypothetical protein
MRFLALAAALSLLAAGSASAQTPVDDPEGTVVSELVVRAKLPGPAWWRVSDADTTIYVLGLPDSFPKNQVWDQSILNRRLQGANTLITPPVLQASASILAAPGLLISARRAMGAEALPGEGLTEEQLATLARVAPLAGAQPARYAELRPWMAGLRLVSDYRKRVGLNEAEPLKSIRRAAGKAKVKAVPASVTQMRAKTLIKQVKAVPPAAGRACFEDAAREVESGEIGRQAAQAWAAGDPRVALGAPRSSERCLAAIPGAARDVRDSHKHQADAVEKALQTPGHAVAALSLRALLAEGGILDQLRQRGFQVRTPE